MRRMALIVASVLAVGIVTTDAGEIGYVEDFSLARDRDAVLKQLIPGTEDFYYYHCLHYQNQGEFDRVDQMLQSWIKRYNYTERVHEIQNRQALLKYAVDSQPSLEHLQRVLELRFDHQRAEPGARADLPIAMDAALIGRETLMREAFKRYQNLDGFEDSALDWLVSRELSPELRRHLLSRLDRPDHAGLAQLVVDDLNTQGSGGFGTLPIHQRMLLDQLEECLRLKPDLLNHSQFLTAYVTKLGPSNDVDVQGDQRARQAYLERLGAFAERLTPAYNSLKAHVLYHRLVFDRAAGVYDKTRFMAYIQLPRSAGYVNPRYLEQADQQRFAVDLRADFSSATRLPPVGDDEPLVRSYLQHFFLAETTYKPYEPYLDDTYLKHAFAETKILHGLGDAEQWSALLPPELYQALKQRVDLDFAFTNPRAFTADELVRLDLFVKNVPTLIVKVYEVNTGNYYRQNLREVNTDINLDGLVANREQTFTYEEPPLRRVARQFEFPELAKPGVYVIDFIGNGQSSRAVVRKGRLRCLTRTGTAGHEFTVLDDRNEKLSKATLWLAGRQYEADEEATITVPFSTRPGLVPIVLSHGEFSSLEQFFHEAENYQLVAGIYVDRESLLAGKTANVIVRPGLYLNGTPITLSVLEEVRLVITSTDHDGVATTKDVADFKLLEDRESVFPFQVPPRLGTIVFSLHAKVQSLSQNKKLDLSAGESFQLNGIDKTEKVEDVHLMNVGGQYVLELLGKTGEPRAHRAVRLTIKHRDFRDPAEVVLQSNDEGQLLLGTLDGVAQLSAIGPQETVRSWLLSRDAHSYCATVHGREGESIQLPYLGTGVNPSRDEFSLLELSRDQYVADRFAALSLADGMLVISGLPRGDYSLAFKRLATQVRVKIAAGESREGHILGEHRQLELRGGPALQIASILEKDDKVHIQLRNADDFARVHVFGTRYEPEYRAYDYFSAVRDRGPFETVLSRHESLYATGRKLGDEYQYIIDRRYAAKYPGNMLARPSLLLNPWAVRKTQTGQQEAEGGAEFKAQEEAAPSARPSSERGGRALAERTFFANLDFLAAGSAVMVNLKPDENGLITIDRGDLDAYQRLWVVAADRDDTTSRALALPKGNTQFVDLRLARGLDPQNHFTQQKQISVVVKNAEFKLADITTARFETYDTLARVYALLVTLSSNPTLVEFGFVLNWDRLDAAEKRAKYSKYACHELNFFLFRKDPAFFESVVLPHLKNKKNNTFLDHWLVGDDVSPYLAPWNHGQLNAVEQILLARRVAGEQVRTARFVGDRFDLLPPDTDRFNFLFDTAVKGSALDAGDRLGITAARTEAGRTAGAAPPRPPAAAAPDGPAGAVADAAPAPAKMDDAPRDKDLKSEKLAEGEDRAEKESLRKGATVAGTERRRALRRLYLTMDQTQEWAENNYYQLPIAQQNADLVKVNAFWRDFAAHDPQQPFLSTSFPEASGSFTEMMFVLSVLDLPLRAEPPKTRFDGAEMTLVAANPMVVFHEQIKPAELVNADVPILVSQNFFRHGDRHRFVNNQRVDKYVTDEFLVQTVYGCQVVVTNPTSSPQKLDLLLQIPVGSVPTLNGHVTRGIHTDLKPFDTTTIEYHFYFPFAGQFPHYPVHVAKNQQLLAFAPPVVLNAVEQLSQVDRESWEYVSQFGTNDEVMTFLREQNLQRVELARIAFRMQDKEFFQLVVQLLAERHLYDHTLWSYAIKHNVPDAIRVYLEHANGFVAKCGSQLQSPLLVIDPVARKTYEHLEYRPLVNARAHRLGRQRQIVNDRLLRQYQQLLRNLGYQRQLDDGQLMEVTYYMLLQDRVEEATSFFKRVNPDKLPTRLQYDYFTAYLDFFTAAPGLAGPIADRYADYPVDHWRNAFAEIKQQLDEIRGQTNVIVNAEDRQQSQTGLAATEPALDFKVEARVIKINYANLEKVRVNYYLMDIELLFSRNPFVQQYSGQFSTIRPNVALDVDLPAGKNSLELDLPEALQNSNVLVEISGAGITRSQAYYANSLAVEVIENYGQVRVTHEQTRQPLGKVYVKVYARMNDESIRFYKDGYTDLRGRFDYSSLSTNDLDAVTRFALLISSEEHGAVVREADPPKR
ncbi:MAG: hypothetical protein FJ276_01335 [Planctomycetes bacterium]|nr:hypothetical protein [Planctomycetota bacterium]